MDKNFQIREIKRTDATEVSQLSTELGSAIKIDLVEEQINTIISDDSHFAFVATIKNEVIGYIHCFISYRLTTAPFLEIGGLIVSEKLRKNGIGKKLVNHIEGRVDHVDKIRVRCNSKRELAHQFYLNLEFNENKRQIIFER